MSTSIEDRSSGLKNRKKDSILEEDDSPELLPEVVDLKKEQAEELNSLKESLLTAESILAPIIFTLISFVLRCYKIGANTNVVWDEAHFGKFGSYYLRHEFYHDVHPPLGKMLVGFSGYLAGYNGSWDFPSGQAYPDYIDFVKMRFFQATFSALCVPLAYFTAKAIGFKLLTVWLFTILVVFESSYVTLGKFILLDSMLLFFTVATMFTFVRFHNERNTPFSRKWWKWLLLTGIAIGCTCSTKMVGLFVTSVVGIYTVVDLWNKFGDKTMARSTYAAHWGSRILALVVIPFLIFLFSFKIHFELLSGSGTGDANMSSLFQANLRGSNVGGGPRDLAIATSKFTVKNQGLGGALLHSHVQTYPEGSKQQQITAYSHKDANNDWFFQRDRSRPAYNTSRDVIEYAVDGMAVRMVHGMTQKNLHSHEHLAPVSRSMFEVSGYGDANIGDPKDDWIIEVVEQRGSEDKLRIHPLTTSFRLKSREMGCYLMQTGKHLPQWGFRQSEIACVTNPFTRDKRTWWNIEEHTNELLPNPGPDFKLPKTSFLKDFVQLNLAMMATNNALVPDPDKQDDLASDAWQWPTLNVGIRLCGWGDENPKYFLIGSPATTWTSSVAVVVFAFLVIYYLIRWQRQYRDFDNKDDLNLFVMGGIYPMFGWGLHFMPFVIMARVTYVHHYLPALYFALLVLCYVFEIGIAKLRTPKVVEVAIYLAFYAFIIGTFWWLRHISFGLEGPAKDYAYLNLLNSWRIG
ncbi:hypothetical protein WICPIJ_004823 [Wickerhamomyces pijperi]|uniref:Dolichyl-phosphate-mannose--protein mannosyltransferase n=1 Tax=Wickerhamomyces pijperi TaxID=599730 RepID=A0A9P8Q6U0_WICPI|nr:hypothetical protein WICPIJ_004823 [Wickerhamomyces pijperi]